MEIVENLVKTTLGEIEKVLSTKTVVGEPMVVEGATLVPLEVMELSREALKHVKVIAEKGNPNSISDAGVAAAMARTACLGASLNVRINLGGIDDPDFKTEKESRMKTIMEEVDNLYQETMATVDSKL